MKDAIEAAIIHLADITAINGDLKAIEVMQLSQAIMNLVNARHTLQIK